MGSANIGLQRVLFSDGNQRAAISAAWDQRVWTSPRLQVNVSPEEWASSNSLDENRLYFNPRHDFSLGPRATFHWLTWRRYDRSFRQEFSAYAAPYWQQNHGTGGAIALSYAQHWKLGESLGFLWGITWNSQPYDGSNEPYTCLLYTSNLGAPEFATADSGIYPDTPLPSAEENNLQYQSGGVYRQNQIIVSGRASYPRFSFFTFYTYNAAKADTNGVTYKMCIRDRF